MSGFAVHLNYLTASRDDASDRDSNVLEDWTRLASSLKTSGTHDTTDDIAPSGSEEHWDSVVDVYSNDASSEETSPLLARVLALPSASSLLGPLSAILSSERPNDSIQDEVLDLIGYESMDILVDIIVDRSKFAKELSTYLQSRSGSSSNVQTTFEDGSLDEDAARRRMEEKLRENAARPLFTGRAEDAPEVLPHVYTSSSMAHGNVLSQFGGKFMLPMGTTRHFGEEYEEVIVPPAKALPPKLHERLIQVSELDPLASGSFPVKFPFAWTVLCLLMVGAPTGAGKTDVAMLAVLRVLDQHRSSSETGAPLASTIHRDAFKIVYVAPMKALASEITRKLGKRLNWLSIKVRELTGDMQLTKSEIAETQIIVTTPEKWDVVTRKPTGEGELASKVKLLIIDEVHLLNDERGAVIETIVARTLRQVESSQSVIRIIGLSATLPNYVDVSDFLSVNRQTGLFYFDSSFRPVPLEQHFIGIKGKPGSPLARKNLDKVAYEKVAELVREGHQVMVFVHSRKDTVKTAMALKEAAMTEGVLDEFSCEDNPSFQTFRRDIATSRNKEMKELFDSGFGIHHAGMLRSDRNMMERMFEARSIKILCCTATLAWGVNLPAHAVIIKGTQVYDSSKGAFTDLSVLDVLQVFGRAGRPGLETSGVGYICTTDDKLTHYLDAVTSQNPIESRFQAGMIDSLNAEIALGTVANVNDAVRWLSYTYLFVRMRKNPFQYGITHQHVANDPQLRSKRSQLVNEAASKLADARMIAYDRHAGTFTITDLGRIAAKYYIRHASIEIFNEEFRPKMTEADVLHMLSRSTEFDQIQVRENEIKELEFIMQSIPCRVKNGTDTSQGKVNILLQGYISGYRPEDFALVSDQAYAAQNGGRVARALMEIAITRKWANASAVLMGMSKAIEKRLWPFDQPLKQFELKTDIYYNLQRFADDYTVAELASMSAQELGELVHMNENHGAAIRNAAKQFPTVRITYDLRPLGSDVLKIAVKVTQMFNWSTKIHGSVEPFWLWIEDHDSTTILQLSHLVFRQNTTSLDVDFVISIPNGLPPPSVTVRFVSDQWMGAEDEVPIPFDTLIMPSSTDAHTSRLDIPYLPLSILHDPLLQDLYGRQTNSFNAIQSQVFWSLVNTRLHSLICAPSGSGKSLMGQIAVWQTLDSAPSAAAWVLVIVPRRSIATELLAELRPVSELKAVSVDFLTTDGRLSPPSKKAVQVVTAYNLLRMLSNLKNTEIQRTFAELRLVLCENLELLDPDQELCISTLMHATRALPVRYIGLSNSLNDPTDLAAWLNVDPMALHSFRPRDRDQALSVSMHSFTIHQSAGLFKVMAKPAHSAIRESPEEQAIVFVPSRGQCRDIALDLITQCALEMETARGYLSEDILPEQLDSYLSRIQDIGLVDFVTRGLGFFHEGLTKSDRILVLEMYAEGLIKVLLVPHDSCWTLPVRAATVVVMSTQYVHITGNGDNGEERQLRDYDLEELVRMQGRAVRHHGAGGHFHLFCQAEVKDTFNRFLLDGLPLESKLLITGDFQAWYDAQKAQGVIRTKQDGVDALSHTFLSRRLQSNPVYYDAASGSRGEVLSRLVDQLNGEA
ncbi:hypothetical protein EUX98_g543 [Antrodiella citrinella]|uniref:Sec63-domain-containing protein n=1 Tax=Antrodiella citrinella TaxID=2447956 RepID=A0A4S4N3R2_9APHY|nr:hypothetical protein EUX98_g543 [Antrodiella citrinella]